MASQAEAGIPPVGAPGGLLGPKAGGVYPSLPLTDPWWLV